MRHAATRKCAIFVNRSAETNTDRQKHKDKDRYRQTLPNTQTRTRGNRQRDTKRRKEIETNDRHGHIETNRDKPRQPERQRETDRQIETEKHKHQKETETEKDRDYETDRYGHTRTDWETQRPGTNFREILTRTSPQISPKFGPVIFSENHHIPKKFARVTSGNLRAASPEATQKSKNLAGHAARTLSKVVKNPPKFRRNFGAFRAARRGRSLCRGEKTATKHSRSPQALRFGRSAATTACRCTRNATSKPYRFIGE